MRRVLFVDDEPQVLESLRDALRPRRREWRMSFATDAETALGALAAEEHDVVVSDMRMPETDGATLLAQVGHMHPGTVRIVLSGYADLDAVARAAAVAHRFLAKPCDVGELVRVVERSCMIAELTQRETLRHAATTSTSLPCVPEVYARLTALLENPDATVREIARLVEQDLGIATKVLQLANSAFFGRGHPIATLGAAISKLGLNALKALVLTVGVFDAFRPTAPIEHFSVEALQRHGALVSRVARHLLADGPAQDASITAALLHDIGMLVLATHEPAHLADVLATAHRERRPLVDVEQERRGGTHADVGAHLLALWGLPHEIVEAVAYHHRPHAVHEPMFDAVAAVYIADTLVDEHRAEVCAEPGPPSAGLDLDYLRRLGVADRLPRWRELTAAEIEAA